MLATAGTVQGASPSDWSLTTTANGGSSCAARPARVTASSVGRR